MVTSSKGKFLVVLTIWLQQGALAMPHRRAHQTLVICPPLFSSAPRSTPAFIGYAAATGNRHQFTTIYQAQKYILQHIIKAKNINHLGCVWLGFCCGFLGL
jgi:hypothetical protein